MIKKLAGINITFLAKALNKVLRWLKSIRRRCVLLILLERKMLIRRFIPKGKKISDYTLDDIAFIEEWLNTLPRKVLNYATPEELFEIHLDKIYAI